MSSYQLNEPIAVIGIACRMPGGANSPAELWRLLIDKHDPVAEGPTDRWDVDAFYDPGQVPGRAVTKWAATLPDITGFDNVFFGLSPAEASSLDPQHRLLLEASWEALEHAGIPPRSVAGTLGGVFIGIWGVDNAMRLAGHYDQLDAYAATIGNTHSTAAGRVSYQLGLHGPSIALDTACSSSLVATHLAVQSLQVGESDFALAGGVNVMLSPEFMISGSRFGMFSPTGRCHAFDADADGLVRGEGVGLVVLKRLSDAERDGDRVLAVIRASAVNQDGRSHGLVAPSEDAQRAVYLEAVHRAGIDPGQVGLVETHGPGTQVGDPIEFRALTPVYGSGAGRCALGSIKSNIGHLESASGIAGLIKTVLALNHGVIPPNLHFQRWNPTISPEGTRFFVPTEATPWPVAGPTRLAAVSSFGFSGTNAHLIVEAPARRVTAVVKGQSPSMHLVPLSATTPQMLPATAQRLARWLSDQDEQVSLDDLVHTLALRRSHHKARMAILATSVGELISTLEQFAAGQQSPKVITGTARDAASSGAVWVFSGQGSQWAGMGQQLLSQDPVFAATIAELEPLIDAEAGFSLTDIISSGELPTEIERIQVVLFGIQIALAEVWRSYGLSPAAVIGHSMGEVSAAVVAGSLSLMDGVRAIVRRARQLTPLAGTGAMASVDLGHQQVAADLAAVPGVTIGVISSPRATVITGDPEPVKELVARWDAQGQLARLVATDVASHGPHLDPYTGALTSALNEIQPQQPLVPFYSTVNEDPRQTPAVDGSYWADNLRKTVRFATAVQAAAEDGYRAFVEVSVHPIVGYAMRDTLNEIDPAVLVAHTLKRGDDTSSAIIEQLAQLFCAGIPIDFSRRYGSAALVDAPTTTWQHNHHWIQTPLPHPGHRGIDGTILHPLLGSPVPTLDDTRLWEADLGTAAQPWLADHQVDGVTVLPGAAYCEMALAVGVQLFDCAVEHIQLRQVHFLQLLPLESHTIVLTALTQHSEKSAQVEIRTHSEEAGWATHATVEVHYRPKPSEPLAFPEPSAAPSEPADAFYTALRADGYQYGPAFTDLDELRVTPGKSASARIAVPAPARTLSGPVQLHPVLLDGCLQTLLAASRTATGSGLLFPVELGSLQIYADPRRSAYCHAFVQTISAKGLHGIVQLVAEDGSVLAQATDVHFAPLQRHSTAERLFHELQWRQAALPRQAFTTSLLVLGNDPLATELSAQSGASTMLTTTEPATLAKVAHIVSNVVFISASSTVDDAKTEVMRVIEVARTLANLDTDPPRLWIVTQGARSVTSLDQPNPAQGGLRGIARVVMCEYPQLRTALVDLDPTAPSTADLLTEITADTAEDEIAWRNGQRWIARLTPTPSNDGSWQSRPQQRLHYGQDGIAIDIARPGDLDTLGLVARPRRAPGPNEVEIQVTAVGLNFADVVTMLDVVPVGTSGRLGLECAGTVVRVGKHVDNLLPGERVMVFADGTAGSFVTAPADLVMPTPPGLTDSQAAGIPGAYLTAWYALTRVARLTAGERILIHAGTGGVGLAAIAIAHSLGAEVLATAGSEYKRAYLHELGIKHVMDSRSLDFVAETKEATAGEGVDVVLNSLSGPALAAGLDTLTIGGRFVELGKRDIAANTTVGLAAFRRNITLSSVDIALLARERPQLIAELGMELVKELTAGRITPLPITTFDLADAATPLRQMAAAQHIGKQILLVPQSGKVTVAVPPGPVVRPGASYVITGGLGGLGLEMARWLAENGAGRIVLNGRSRPSAEATQVIAEINAAGTKIDVVQGDIADMAVAQQLVATADHGSLAGILHAAAVLDDSALSNLDESRLDKVWQPKVAGAWNLHQATAGHQLDWFVLFSSIAALLGSPGQGNYAAANDWLDSFASWRRSQGLPALAVNWGAWGQAGRATELGRKGYATFSTAEGLTALTQLIDRQKTNAGVFVYDPQHWFHATPGAASSPLFADMPTEATQTPNSEGDFRDKLSAAAPAQRRRLTSEYLQAGIQTILGQGETSIDVTTTLSDLGFDSLTALQLRNRLETDLGVKVPANVVWTHPTLASLTDYLLERLGLATAANNSAPAKAPISPHNTWFRTFASHPDANARLYCFPHAGGAASTYRRWSGPLGDQVQLYSLQLPGREDRAAEMPVTDLIALAEELATIIAEHPDQRPFGFFGHSGGSLLAFQTALALQGQGLPMPVILGLSAVPAPDSPAMARVSAQLFQVHAPNLLEALADIPDDVRNDPELFAQARHALETDYVMYRSYRYQPGHPPLNCPLIVFGGASDPLLQPSELDGWSKHSGVSTEKRIYSGGHFYLRDHIPAITTELATLLRG